MVGTTATAEISHLTGVASTGDSNFESFEGRAPVRNRLHRIAADAALSAVESRKHWMPPTGLTEPRQAPEAPPVPPAPPPAAIASVPAANSAPQRAGAQLDAAASAEDKVLSTLAWLPTRDTVLELRQARRPGAGAGRISWFPDPGRIPASAAPPSHPAPGAGAC